MKIVFYCISCVLLFFGIHIYAQEDYTQSIRGNVVDAFTNSSLPGATIIIIGSNPVKGTTSGEDGSFILKDIPLGRVSLRVSYIGYNAKEYSNLIVSAGRELILKIELEEKVFQAKEVIITIDEPKDETLNKLTTVSGRSFSVQETNHFAGSLGDPARMAQNFAGVVSAGDSRNDIVIRGNSPMGLLWRMEGIEIYNPNHFGALGTTGGPVSMLNNNLLTNSDFFTGAFPSEYGNALSGVFDLRMRSGNNKKYEFVGQVGFNGFEFGAEGPFSKKSNASFFIDYRYSTLALFETLGLKTIAGSSVPDYQDLTLKIDLPTKKAGKFVLFGIGGISNIQLYDSEKDSSEFSFGLSGTDTDFGSDMGVIGLYHIFYFNPTTRLKTNFSIQGVRSTIALDSINKQLETKKQYYRSNLGENKYNFSTHLLKKFNTKDMLVSGIIFDHFKVNYVDSVYLSDEDQFHRQNNSQGNFNLFQAYSQWKHNFSSAFNFTIGLHYQYFGLNGSQSIEPRAGFKWNIRENQSFNFGYGLHTQIQPKMIYFVETEVDNELVFTNKNLGFTRSNQLVLGYNYLLGQNFRIQTEVYYQFLNRAPVKESLADYSILNEGANFYISLPDSLINNGTGQNYGFELTVEKFFAKNYYFLFTASLFESNYKGYNMVMHSTAFNNNFVFNILGGYEFQIGSKNRLNIDLRGVYAGGKRYIPIDEVASKEQNKEVLQWSKAYSEKYKDYFRIDLKVSFHRNSKRMDQEFAVDIQNLTNYQNIFLQTWDPGSGEVRTDYQQGFFPMFLYRIYF
ncbi:MAG: TonB-dependent receptor [Bacteroidales bacterium]|nr:TonB-dependent receptor [Bacteroidales bacterium]